MLALYRSGRQAEALETYQAARGALIEELGIEPSRRIRDLHQAILVQDPHLSSIRGPSVRRARNRPRTVRGCIRGTRARAGRAGGSARGRPGRSRPARPDRRRARHRQEPADRRADRRCAPARGAGAGRPLLGGGRRAGILALGAVAAQLRPRERARRAANPARRRGGGTRSAAARPPRALSRSSRAADAGVRGCALSAVRGREFLPATRRGGASAGAGARRLARRG